MKKLLFNYIIYALGGGKACYNSCSNAQYVLFETRTGCYFDKKQQKN